MCDTPITIAEIKDNLVQDLIKLEFNSVNALQIDQIEEVYQAVFDLLCQAQRLD